MKQAEERRREKRIHRSRRGGEEGELQNRKVQNQGSRRVLAKHEEPNGKGVMEKLGDLSKGKGRGSIIESKNGKIARKGYNKRGEAEKQRRNDE